MPGTVEEIRISPSYIELCLVLTMRSRKFLTGGMTIPMGNPLSPFLALFFKNRFETNESRVLQYFPRIWLRYDDSIPENRISLASFHNNNSQQSNLHPNKKIKNHL